MRFLSHLSKKESMGADARPRFNSVQIAPPPRKSLSSMPRRYSPCRHNRALTVNSPLGLNRPTVIVGCTNQPK
jgi:hypothetical protein